jgi:hypothetical protein
MAKRPEDWPLLLCGPMLRRVEPASVSVFVALKHARQVALSVFDGGVVVAQGTATTLAFGKYLHVTVVTATPTGSALVPGKVYAYDLTFTADAGVDPLDTDRAVKTLASPGLAGPGSLLEGTLALGYANNARPGFALPPAGLKDLRLAHASCRKPHGEGTDALPILDTIIRQSHASATERPHQLFLTGDQIYADDVAVPLLEQLMVVAKDLLWGTDEVLPARQPGGIPPTAAEIAPGVRDEAVKPPLTSGAATCHLIRLGEFAGMYLFAWSDALWGELTPQPPPVQESSDSDHTFSAKLKKAKTYNSQIRSLKHFRNALGKVRRALANVPTYMAFDDHEITDDWYLHRRMRENVLDSPLGRRIVSNGLSAYAVFQAWGNTPTQFSAGEAGGLFLSSLSQWRGDESSARYTDIRTALGTASASSPPELRFDYEVIGPEHHVIVLDTRTRRAYPSANDKDQADLLSQAEIDVQVGERIPSRSSARKRLTVLLSPAPVFGHPLPEFIQDLASNVASATTLDHETWLVTSRRAAFEHLLKTLVPCRSVLILSGDVHYAFTFSVRYWNERTPVVESAAYVQLVSSALKNQSGETKILAGLSATAPQLFLGWPSEGRHVRVTESQDWWVRGNPAVYRHKPSDLGTVDPPKWRYQVGFVEDARLLEHRTGRARPVRAPGATAFDRSLAAALEQRNIAKNDQMRCAVGVNNVAIVRFATTPAGAPRPMLLAQQSFWFRFDEASDSLPFTAHWADLTPPAGDEPPPIAALSQANPPATAAAWESVISYRPPTAVQTALLQRSPALRPKRLELSVGSIRLDWYGLRVSVMPTVAGVRLDPKALLRYFRLEIASDEAMFLDRGQARFAPSQPTDAMTWASSNPAGAVMDIQTKLADVSNFGASRIYNGTVVVAEATDSRWTFVTLAEAEWSIGALTGNREFGFSVEGASTVYYTRGSHRSTPFQLENSPIALFVTDNYLRSMMAALMLYVNDNGGTAALEPRTTADYGWVDTQRRYHHPTVEWLP